MKLLQTALYVVISAAVSIVYPQVVKAQQFDDRISGKRVAGKVESNYPTAAAFSPDGRQVLIGWGTSVTMDIYTHVLPAQEHVSAEAMDGVFG